MVAVNPNVLRWARENALLEAETAAKRIGLRDSSLGTAVEKLAEFELGNEQPSRAQLHKMAKAYHQPLLSLYLDEPPAKAVRGQDFRSLPQRTADAEGNARLDLLLRNVRAAQGLARALLEDEQVAPLPFIAAANMNEGYESVARDIVENLAFELQHFRKQGTVDKAFAYLRKCLEDRGIFVLLLSNLGSWHTKIDASVFRGFSLSDPIAPFIVINNQDAKTSWAFTAFHEAAHLWLGSTGISGAWGPESPGAIETFCNRVAGAALLPNNEVAEFGPAISPDVDKAADQIGGFAKPRRVSRAMVAYSLLLSNHISQARWRALQKRFDVERRASAAALREQQRQQKPRIDSNVVRKRDLGPALRGLVKRSMDSGALTPRKAGIVLGVNPRRVEALLDG